DNVNNTDNVDTAQTLYESAMKASEAKNYAQSAQLFRQAAELGHAEAQRELGVAYIQGLGVEKNGNEAVKWLQIAIMKGKTKAKNYLEEYEKNEEAEKMQLNLRDGSTPEGVKLTEDGEIEGVEPITEEAVELPESLE
ncbi:MAG: hypothetical protein Q4C70_15685, partial [Planctomycetia bacterium]|nr:hypothetical protein [Planctomycetia bacterium]